LTLTVTLTLTFTLTLTLTFTLTFTSGLIINVVLALIGIVLVIILRGASRGRRTKGQFLRYVLTVIGHGGVLVLRLFDLHGHRGAADADQVGGSINF
jgi:hypothetical protein